MGSISACWKPDRNVVIKLLGQVSVTVGISQRNNRPGQNHSMESSSPLNDTILLPIRILGPFFFTKVKMPWAVDPAIYHPIDIPSMDPWVIPESIDRRIPLLDAGLCAKR